jgi:hypothetical protein
MKKKLLQLFIVPMIILGIGSCSDKGGGDDEANLVVTKAGFAVSALEPDRRQPI